LELPLPDAVRWELKRRALRARVGAAVDRSIQLNRQAAQLQDVARMVCADARNACLRTRTAIELSKALRRIRGSR
jgi:hypothetical protein